MKNRTASWRSRPIVGAMVILALATPLDAQFKNANHSVALADIKGHTHVSAFDSTEIGTSSTGKYWIAAAQVVGSDVVMWSYFRFISKDVWARIDIHSIKNNFKTGFWWDEDGFMGNQFNHPYHGSSYYNAARVNGLTFWESVPYALGGSAIWELFLETEPPSTNDIVTTPVSGIILGEISYRITDLILDNSKRGMDRILRETSSFLINPMRGFNRLIRGELWQMGPAPSRPDYAMSLSVGGNNVFRNRTLRRNHGYMLARFDMEYGDLLAASLHRDPFDYFNVHAEFNFSRTETIMGIFASGVLWDRKVTLFDNTSTVFGIYKEFDLLNNLTYHLTTTSVSSRLTGVHRLSPKITLRNSIGLSAILMGGVNSQHAEVYGKKYNIGPGAKAKLAMLMTIHEYGSVYLNYQRFWLHTLNGVNSEEFVGLLNIGTNYAVGTTTMLGFDLLLYDRYGDYKDLPHIKDANSAVRLYAKFLLG